LIILGLDTSLAACSLALIQDDYVIAQALEPMQRGQQERLAPMVRDLLSSAGVQWPEVSEMAVTVGPGSFTGLRIGLAFAKGLSAGLSIPARGISTLEGLARTANSKRVTAVVIDARQGRIFFQIFENGQPLMAPDLLLLENAAARLAELAPHGLITLTGPGASLLAGLFPDAELAALEAVGPLAFSAQTARLGLKPLYLRDSYAEEARSA
jgi:tRNA threonylcarbamoyladenosine biosynthesis protein TsaB